MKWRTIIWRRMRLQGISTAVFLMLAILSLTLNGSEGTRRSIKSFEDPKTLAKTEVRLLFLGFEAFFLFLSKKKMFNPIEYLLVETAKTAVGTINHRFVVRGVADSSHSWRTVISRAQGDRLFVILSSEYPKQ